MNIAETVLEQFPLPLVLLDSGCLITQYNSEFSDLVGLSDENLLGCSVTSLCTVKCQSQILSDIAGLGDINGATNLFTTTLVSKGASLDVRVVGRSLIQGNDAVGVILTIEPLPNDKPFTSSPTDPGIWQTGNEAEVIFRREDTLCNSVILAHSFAAKKMFGLTSDAHRYENMASVQKMWTGYSLWLEAEKALREGRPFEAQYEEDNPPIGKRLIDWHLKPLDPSDSQKRIWIDQRKVHSDASLPQPAWHESAYVLEEKHFGSEVGIWSWNLVTNEMKVSRGLVKALGYKIEDISNLVTFFRDVFPPDELVEYDKVVSQSIKQRKPFRTVRQLKGADGRLYYILIRGQPTLDENGVPVELVGTETNITEQVRLNQKLESAEKIAKVGNWSHRVGSALMYWSDEVYRIHGLDRSTSHSPMPLAKAGIHPDDLHLVSNGERRLLQKWRMDPDSIERHRTRIIRPDGSIRYCEICAKVEEDSNGRPYELVGTVQDITELVETEEKLLRAQQMEVVGHLAGGAAHDFNNLLAVIMGNLELMHEGGGTLNQSDLINSALQATRRGADLTRNLLSFARQAVLNPQRLDVTELMKGMQSVLRRVLPVNIRLEIVIKENSWTIHADRPSFENAILNLVINSRDSILGGGVITIESENQVLTEKYIEDRQETLQPGPYVVISISDTGSGISPELLLKVFTPYFTTKQKDEGSGLGLSMVHGFARQSGGGVRIYSECDVGTTIKLYFPASDLDASMETEMVINEPSDSVAGRVLLVEDNAEVRRIVKLQLEGIGLDCLSADCGDSALELFTEEDGIDLLVTDIVMPGSLQGPDLARKLRSMQKSLKVIFISGYPNEASIHGNGLRPEDIGLMKPISRHALHRAVHQVLQS